MPTYEYGCSNCGNEWELDQRISANPIRKCPKCKKLKAKRLISGGGFILKGSGWASDLYHKPAVASTAGAPKTGESKDSSSTSDSTSSASDSTSKSESKPKSDSKKSKKKKGKSDAA